MNWIELTLIVLTVISVAASLGFVAAVLALVFAAVICAGGIGAFLPDRWFKSAGLAWVDRLLGGAWSLCLSCPETRSE